MYVYVDTYIYMYVSCHFIFRRFRGGLVKSAALPARVSSQNPAVGPGFPATHRRGSAPLGWNDRDNASCSFAACGHAAGRVRTLPARTFHLKSNEHFTSSQHAAGRVRAPRPVTTGKVRMRRFDFAVLNECGLLRTIAGMPPGASGLQIRGRQGEEKREFLLKV